MYILFFFKNVKTYFSEITYSFILFCVFFLGLCIWENTLCKWGEGHRKGGKENLKQTPHCMGYPVWGLIPWPMRSWSKLEPRVRYSTNWATLGPKNCDRISEYISISTVKEKKMSFTHTYVGKPYFQITQGVWFLKSSLLWPFFKRWEPSDQNRIHPVRKKPFLWK